MELLSTDNLEIIKDRSNKLIALNNKRKLIEQNILVVTVKAGYGNASYNYFQGVIDSVNTTQQTT